MGIPYKFIHVKHFHPDSHQYLPLMNYTLHMHLPKKKGTDFDDITL